MSLLQIEKAVKVAGGRVKIDPHQERSGLELLFSSFF